MKRIAYADKQPGDILLVANNTNEFSKLIELAEKAITPGLDWYPSHVAICSSEPGRVKEAWFQRHPAINSACADNDIHRYDNPPVEVEVWRPEGTPEQMMQALTMTVNELAGHPYGGLDLIGFLLEALARGAGWTDAPNLIKAGYVCSETGLFYLRQLDKLQTSSIAHGPLVWTQVDEAIRNVAPSTLRALFLRHEVKA